MIDDFKFLRGSVSGRKTFDAFMFRVKAPFSNSYGVVSTAPVCSGFPKHELEMDGPELTGAVDTTPEEFEIRGFTLKRFKCFPSTLRRRNLKTKVSLSKRIKCFSSTLHRRNLKTQQSSVILDLGGKLAQGNHIINQRLS